MKKIIYLIVIILIVSLTGCKDIEIDDKKQNKEYIEDKSINNKIESDRKENLSEYILSNSDKDKLVLSDLENLSDWELKLARNEIFARKGYVFKDKKLKEYFESKSWYEADSFYKAENLSHIEKYNINFIKNHEQLDYKNIVFGDLKEDLYFEDISIVKKGKTEADILKTLGKPLSIKYYTYEGEQSEEEGAFTIEYEYDFGKIIFVDQLDDPNIVWVLEVTSPKYNTIRKIKVGDTVQTLLNKLPNYNVYPSKNNSNEGDEYIKIRGAGKYNNYIDYFATEGKINTEYEVDNEVSFCINPSTNKIESISMNFVRSAN
ncbi:YARHG domain-containing protein [Tepidibacter hydrothermalis]|uniref:YARHG domain-containing protein n=1 Tax=Tepidibacter hydrothermalis TaxID=3036126 RepID=A0ABY8EHH9_9FIRM|nr:YARHG domain-containing protein [Tepidibacter hydrothermalis]WFD12427.1 YARHG domain-containing protein [Tepidibacter hydrothermalis]